MDSIKVLVRCVCILVFLQLIVMGVSASPISFGETIIGNISSPGETDSYTFDGKADDVIYSRIQADWSHGISSYGVRIRLYDPDGFEINTATAGYASYYTDMMQTLPDSGTYTIIVEDSAGSGTGFYGLFIQRTNEPGHAEPFDFGETKHDSITKKAEMKNFTFSAHSGDTIYSKIQADWSHGISSYGVQIQLYAPDGTLLNVSTAGYASTVTDLTRTLPSTGNYTLLAGDSVGSGTGTFGLFIQRTNNPGHAEPFDFGETKHDAIMKQAEMKNFTFSAQAGDTIYSKIHADWSHGISSYGVQIRLYAPDGTLLNVSTAGYASTVTDLTRTLPSTGNYTLLAGDSAGYGIGTFGLFLQRTNNPGHAASIIFGETLQDSLTKQAEMKNFTFSGSACDVIYSRIQADWSHGISSFGVQIRLYAPNGTVLNVSTAGYTSTVTDVSRTLPGNGNYLLLAGDSAGYGTGSFGLSLQRTGTRKTAFSANKTAGTAPLAVRFTDESPNSPTAWNWSFGDGTSYSEEQNPVYTYTTNGTYTVSLNTTNGFCNGNISTRTGYITVYPPAPLKIGVVRNGNTWLLDASGNGAYGAGDLSYIFGKAGDAYVTGDWNNDGKTEIGVVRNNNTWLLDASGNGAYGAGDVAYSFGKAGDVFVTGDWNTDGKTEIGVVRNGNMWLLDASGNGAYGAGDVAYSFGKAGDVFVTGDWNTDGKTEIGVVRNGNTWLLDASGDGKYSASDLSYTFGKAGDTSVTGTWS